MRGGYSLTAVVLKSKNIEAKTDTTKVKFFEGVLYFGWPNQPSQVQ